MKIQARDDESIEQINMCFMHRYMEDVETEEGIEKQNIYDYIWAEINPSEKNLLIKSAPQRTILGTIIQV
ncbi:hypothetical protein GCM10007216_03750 [Thalassobacillus devorans]|uniref:Uncharacterized protein n=1 Tax=Thalassobacillus devorans TaxID=279813 RepID=A0ABQ1NGK7_9BACI|nr:hypothetical protein [Thalassobacillus devorans]NIK27284.1 hypothetical protein [Thalassobacillus devorans]GGC76452.1 hypothetical protein GCM10007216_03750 [Thalassobacillus devorans]